MTSSSAVHDSGGIELIRADALVEDLDIYPRERLDDQNTNDLARTLTSLRDGGSDLETVLETIPAVVAEAGSLRLVDGWHRRRAYLKVDGPDALVPTRLSEYASEADLFADAVRRNRHGRGLTSGDEVRAVRRLQAYGLSAGQVAVVMRIPPARVETIACRVVITPAGEAQPLKARDGYLAGRTMNAQQLAALAARTGTSYTGLARQIIRGLQEDLLPTSEQCWEAMRELHEVLGDVLSTRVE